MFFFWVLHWLVYKRSDYLVSRGSRGKLEHFKLLFLYCILIGYDFTISFIFYDKFSSESLSNSENDKMNEIYVIIGFEVTYFLNTYKFVRLLLKAIED